MPIILAKRTEGKELLTRKGTDKKKNPRTPGNQQPQVPAVSHTSGTQKDIKTWEFGGRPPKTKLKEQRK